MATKLTSTGIQFPDNTTQTSAGVSRKGLVVFRSRFDAANSSQWRSLYDVSPLTTINMSNYIDSHNGFNTNGGEFQYTVQVAGFYHVTGFVAIYQALGNPPNSTAGARLTSGSVFLDVNDSVFNPSNSYYRYYGGAGETSNQMGAQLALAESYFKGVGPMDVSMYDGTLSHWTGTVERIWHFEAGDTIKLKATASSYVGYGTTDYGPPIYYRAQLCGYYLRSK